MVEKKSADGSSDWAAVAAPFEHRPSPTPRAGADPAAASTAPAQPGAATGPEAPVDPFSPGAWAFAHAPTRAGPLRWPPAPKAASAGELSSGRDRGSLIVVLLALAVLAGSIGVFWLEQFQDDGAATVSAAEGDAEPVPPTDGQVLSETPPPPSSQQEPTASPETGIPEDAALAELEALRAQSLTGLVLDGRWVAQMASKSVGLTAALQTAQNGTNTFYAADILAESLAVQSLVTDPSQVLVLHSVDFGRALTAPDGQPFWVTLVDGGFGSSADVQAWCAQTYPDLDPAALVDRCVPRTLTPPPS
jgi:hypothetical protein